MVRVDFKQANISVEIEKGATILEAARKAGVIIDSPCNGAGICGKCLVRIDRESFSRVVQKGDHHSIAATASDLVLACQTEIYGDIAIENLPNLIPQGLNILRHGQSLAVERDCLITKKYDSELDVTLIHIDGRLLGTEKGNTVGENYGVVIDIGTTTLVAALVDIDTGNELSSISALNPQALQAQDVLSRIRFASEEAGLAQMHTGLIQEINRMITEIANQAQVKKRHIYEVVFSGNTCMLHLAANVNPESLGKYPYTPVIDGDRHLKAIDYNLDIAEFGLIYLPPIISAYIGADIVSGILACKLYETKGITLLVDIGTNGEMVLAANGKLVATSTAAGPAFEGMNITYGMRAGVGAIESFEITSGEVIIKTIGGVEPVGICGSGLLDIVGELVAYGVIDKNGRLKSPKNVEFPEFIKERLISQGGRLVFSLSEQVWLSQKDIRQVQLAKGAIRSGIEFLLAHEGLTAAAVDRVLIAGSFGYHLREKSLINLGLLPREFAGKVAMVGNTSKSGGQAFLLNKRYRREMAVVVKRVTQIELASFKDFDQVFVKCLGF